MLEKSDKIRGLLNFTLIDAVMEKSVKTLGVPLPESVIFNSFEGLVTLVEEINTNDPYGYIVISASKVIANIFPEREDDADGLDYGDERSFYYNGSSMLECLQDALIWYFENYENLKKVE